MLIRSIRVIHQKLVDSIVEGQGVRGKTETVGELVAVAASKFPRSRTRPRWILFSIYARYFSLVKKLPMKNFAHQCRHDGLQASAR